MRREQRRVSTEPHDQDGAGLLQRQRHRSVSGVRAGKSADLDATSKNNNASHVLLANGARRSPAQLSLSAKGTTFIAAHEGFRSTVYNDAGGNCTIGYGHLIHKGVCTAADTTKWKTLTVQAGQKLLATDATVFVRGIRSRLATTPLSQNEFDALVSFTYNIGLTNFDTSSVKADLKKSPADYAAVPAHLKVWVYSNKQFLCGLYKRRVHEGDLFRIGSYDAAAAVTCPRAAPADATGEGFASTYGD